ncbi:MAG: CinA family protein [Epsilonproteobacteria bacterium]|nr:CinA family protein [Campylobacterota bacterium]NPA63503.1 CinA family protein [Campylobacterota bacterium]
MKNGILFIGKEFSINRAFCDYLSREAQKRLWHIDSLHYLSEKDKDLLFVISEAFKYFDNTLIVTSTKSYPTASKIVATLFEDNLVATPSGLIPSKATKVTQDSFLIGSDHLINLIKADPTKSLPPILLESSDEVASLYLFDTSPKKIDQILQPLAASYNIDYHTTKITAQLYQIHAQNKRYGDLGMFLQNAKLMLPKNVIVAHNIFAHLIDRLSQLQKSVTFAESCTGGLLASMLTQVPGSSAVFDGSVVTYSNQIKHRWLGVREQTLQTYGAVSEETVQEMLQGALALAQAHFAIAISGIAGPTGATPTKPVGTVVVGAGDGDGQIVRTMHFEGDRNYIQYQAAMYGIKLLYELASDELF